MSFSQAGRCDFLPFRGCYITPNNPSDDMPPAATHGGAGGPEEIPKVQLPCQRCGQTSAGCWVCERCTMINCKAQAEIRFTKRGVGGKGSWKSAVFWFIGEGPIFPWFGWQCLCCFFLKDCQPTDLIYLPIYIYCIYIYQKKGISTIYIYMYRNRGSKRRVKSHRNCIPFNLLIVNPY